MDNAATIIITSCNAPCETALSNIFAKRGSTGSWDNWRPAAVNWRFSPALVRTSSNAPNSSNSFIPSWIWRLSGASTNGNASISSKPNAVICKITEAKLVRKISGSVNSGRELKSSSEYKRIQIPSLTRPQRPLRWLADACEIGSIGKRCTLVR